MLQGQPISSKQYQYQGGCQLLSCCTQLTTRTGVTQMMYMATASWICIHLQDKQHLDMLVALLLVDTTESLPCKQPLGFVVAEPAGCWSAHELLLHAWHCSCTSVCSLPLLLMCLLPTHAVRKLPSGKIMSFPSSDLDAVLSPYSCKEKHALYIRAAAACAATPRLQDLLLHTAG
jgi:hypothetical protein